MNLHDFDLVIINSSGGKDSVVSIWEILRIATIQNYPKSRIVVSHQDLGEAEWPGTKELVEKQSAFFGLKTYYSKRRDKNGKEETLLEYVLRRKKWPSSTARYCTSDFKRGPGSRVVTELTKELGKCKILYCFGFRKEESPSRKKKEPFVLNTRLTTQRRIVYDYLPVHEWSSKNVWDTIKENNLPYHYAYDLNMPRHSCILCIYTPFDGLVISGKANPELLDKYIEVENSIGHLFRENFSLQSVKDAIENGYEPKSVPDWVM